VSIRARCDKANAPNSAEDQSVFQYVRVPQLKEEMVMQKTNKEYVDRLRGESCYPFFRAYMGIILVLSYLLAAIVVIAPFLMDGHVGAKIMGFVVGVIIIVIAKFLHEVGSMIADIADSTIDMAGYQRASTSQESSTVKTTAIEGGTISRLAQGYGKCQRCEKEVPVESVECPHCKADFGAYSEYKVIV
jgi:hypothetical protein